MGVSQSKIIEDKKSTTLSLNQPNTPRVIPTSQSKDIDPRSPSIEIARTPVETAPISSLEVTQLFNDAKNTDVPSYAVRCLHKNDSVEKKYLKDASTLKNLKKSSISSDDEHVYEESSLSNTSRSLENASHSQTPRRIADGVLETNFDFVETDIDVVLKNKNLQVKNDMQLTPTPKQILRNKFLKNKTNCNVVQLDDPRSPTIGIDRTPVQIFKSVDDSPALSVSPLNSESKFFTPIHKDESSDKFAMNQVAPNLNIFENIENFQQKLDSLCINDTIDDDSNDESSNTSDENEVFEEKTSGDVNIIEKIKEIYEDDPDDENNSTELNKKKNIETIQSNAIRSGGRTPLGVRNGNNHQHRSKSASGRLNNIQTYKKDVAQYKIKKIPVFQHKDVKKIRGKVLANENTPPTTNPRQNLSKNNKSQWDFGDNTMII